MSDRHYPSETTGTTATNSEERKKRTIRRLTKRIRRRNVAIALLVIVAILMLGHIVYCLINHVYAPKYCTLCGLDTKTCTCLSDMEQLSNRIVELEEENAQLNDQVVTLEEENELLQAEQAISLMEQNDGLCHSACPVHCPDCMHNSTSNKEEWEWKIIGTKSVCREGTCTIKVVCNDCGKELNSYTKDPETDTDHSYGGDRTCDDCGYTKPSQSYQPDPTKKPTVTAEPTKKPTVTAEPTKKPTVTAEPTKKPTVTAEPTATPKPQATECPHSSTYKKEGDWNWTDVGSSGTCQTATRKVKVYCSACNELLDSYDESKDDSSHNFKGRKCLDCGYTKPLTEGSATADGTIPPSQSETEYEDGEVANPVS